VAAVERAISGMLSAVWSQSLVSWCTASRYNRVPVDARNDSRTAGRCSRAGRA
jgi:hypothetical protein